MSDAKSKRAPRAAARGNGTRNNPEPAAPVEPVPQLMPETAAAAVALETAAIGAIVAEAASSAAGPTRKPMAAAEDVWAAWTESQSAVARGFEALATELTAMTRTGIAAATDAAKALIGAKTFAEAVEINAGLARRSFDAAIGGAAKISEIGVKAATEASRPILNSLGENWNSPRVH